MRRRRLITVSRRAHAVSHGRARSVRGVPRPNIAAVKVIGPRQMAAGLAIVAITAIGIPP